MDLPLLLRASFVTEEVMTGLEITQAQIQRGHSRLPTAVRDERCSLRAQHLMPSPWTQRCFFWGILWPNWLFSEAICRATWLLNKVKELLGEVGNCKGLCLWIYLRLHCTGLAVIQDQSPLERRKCCTGIICVSFSIYLFLSFLYFIYSVSFRHLSWPHSFPHAFASVFCLPQLKQNFRGKQIKGKNKWGKLKISPWKPQCDAVSHAGKPFVRVSLPSSKCSE